MLRSKGYFSKFNCPFDECIRPYCHYQHLKTDWLIGKKKSITNHNFDQLKEVVAETVKQLSHHFNIIGEYLPDTSTIVENITSKIQYSTSSDDDDDLLNNLNINNQFIPNYSPTPIKQLNKHIPVQIVPNKPNEQYCSPTIKNAATDKSFVSEVNQSVVDNIKIPEESCITTTDSFNIEVNHEESLPTIKKDDKTYKVNDNLKKDDNCASVKSCRKRKKIPAKKTKTNTKLKSSREKVEKKYANDDVQVIGSKSPEIILISDEEEADDLKQSTSSTKIRRIIVSGGGLPCNSLNNGPFPELLKRWTKAKEKIQKSEQIKDNEYKDKSSEGDEHNEVPTEIQDEEMYDKIKMKRRIAHKASDDPSLNTILERKLHHVKISLK